MTKDSLELWSYQLIPISHGKETFSQILIVFVQSTHDFSVAPVTIVCGRHWGSVCVVFMFDLVGFLSSI